MSDRIGNGSAQLGFDLGEAPAQSFDPDVAEVRAELAGVLATAKAAVDDAPWDARTFLFHKVVFPQMATWLPDDERDQMCFEFAREVARIELLMAA
jgi:hypothetical protein